MSWKGTKFTGPNDPNLPARLMRLDEEARRAFVKAHNERWKVVKTCKVCKEPMIGEEVVQHTIDHIESGDARVLCGMYVRAIPKVRTLFRKWLKDYGE